MPALTEKHRAGPVRRPRNRKRQIVDAATDLFHRSDYDRVGIDDVGAAVGITGGAIYRHFANKQDMLAHTLRAAVQLLEAGVERQLAEPRPPRDALDRTLRSLAALAVEHRALGVLLNREMPHLPRGERIELGRRCRAVAARLAAVGRAARPQLPEADVHFLAECALAVLASPSYHHATPPRRRFEDLLHQLAATLFGATVLPPPATPGRSGHGDGHGDIPMPENGFVRTSRRETLVTAAAQLFARSGYHAVSMDDVGKAVGIAGPSVYAHFASKAELLAAGLYREAEWLQFGMSRAMAASTTPGQVLQRLVASYVGESLEHTDLFRVLLTESIHLSEEDGHRLRRIQHDYVSEWTQLLSAARPELTEPDARVITHAVLAIINHCAGADRWRRRPTLRNDLVTIGIGILGISGPDGG